MFFILRMVFWIAVVALLLPASPGQHAQSLAGHEPHGSYAEQAVAAAMSLCATSPDKCAAGLDSARRLGELLSNPVATAAGQAPAPLRGVIALPPPRPAIP
jgi:hypothetical protein